MKKKFLNIHQIIACIVIMLIHQNINAYGYRCTAENDDESALASSLRAPTAIPVGVNTNLANFYDAPLQDLAPLSPAGAMGPSQFIGTLASGVISMNRSGARDYQLYTTSSSFFNTIFDILDVQARFDKLTNRWFIVGFNINIASGVVTAPLHIFIGVSNSADITATTQWQIFDLQQDQISPVGNIGAGIPNGPGLDHVSIAIDAHTLYVGVNLYTAGTATFENAAVFVIQKQSLLDGGPAIATAFRGLNTQSGIFAPIPVDNFNNPNPEFGYVIGINSTISNQLEFYRIINPGSTTPTISAPINITVLNTAQPVSAFMKNVYGNLGTLFMIDSALYASHTRDGQLFTVRHIGVDQNGSSSGQVDRTGVRWTQLNPSAGGVEIATTVPTVTKEGTLYDNGALTANTRFFYFPSIMTNKNDVMILNGSVSAELQTINSFAAHTHIADPINDTDLRNSVQLLTTSNATYQAGVIQFFGRTFWGSYSYTSIDPLDDATFWTVQQYVKATDLGTVQVIELQA